MRKSWIIRILVSAFLAIIAFLIRRYVAGMHLSASTDALVTLVMFIVLTGAWTFFANINRWLESIIPFGKNTTLRITIQLIMGAGLVLFIRLGGMYLMREHLPFKPEPIVIAIIIGLDIFLALTINLAVISHYIIQLWKQSLIKNEQLESEKMQMQYLNLKNQVNPHFLFNTFAFLSALIEENPDAAARHTGHLAKLYRYALSHEEQVLVPLNKELEMLRMYIEILEKRYESGIQFKINTNEKAPEYKIIHMSIQNIVDNALKHNTVHSQKPLIIEIATEENYLVIRNNIQAKTLHEKSTKKGLESMKKLYLFYTQTPFNYQSEDGYFTVTIPLLEK
jgi:sensor histidine kinase YesM